MRALALLLTVCLAIGLGVSSTLAYISIKTSSIVNRFAPGNVPAVSTLNVPLNIVKTVACTGDEKIGPEGFRFKLADSVSGATIATLTSDAQGRAATTLSYNYNDIGKTFGYLLSEINDGRENVTYSEQTYYIQVYIQLDEAQDMLVPVLHVNGQQVYRLEAAFENMYYVETPVPPTGDETPVALLTAMLLLSFVGLCLLRKKRA